MWTIKIRIREKWNPYNLRCNKFGVKIYFYSLNNYKDKNNLYAIGSGIIQGEEKNKEAFFRSLRQDKKIVKIERNKDFFVGIYKEPLKIARKREIELAYDPSIIHLKPVIFDEEGWEEWEFASPKKEIFERILDSKRIKNKEVESELLYFGDKKIENIKPLTIFPKLTPKQEKAISLAVKEGYYDFPRKIDLIKLAKKNKNSLSTFQVHLRKAESKTIPIFLRSIQK